jgi:hypothetical protein
MHNILLSSGDLKQEETALMQLHARDEFLVYCGRQNFRNAHSQGLKSGQSSHNVMNFARTPLIFILWVER